MKGDLVHCLAEARAVHDAQLEVERATDALIENISRTGAPKSWAARVRFQQAMLKLQAAEAKLHFSKSALAGARHLRIA